MKRYLVSKARERRDDAPMSHGYHHVRCGNILNKCPTYHIPPRYGWEDFVKREIYLEDAAQLFCYDCDQEIKPTRKQP